MKNSDSAMAIAVLSVITGIVFSIYLLLETGMRLTFQTGLLMTGLPSSFALLHMRYRKDQNEQRLSLFCGSLAILFAAAFAAAIIAHVGLRLHMPLQDQALAGFDQAIGINVQEITAIVSNSQNVSYYLGLIYQSAFPAIFASVAMFSFLERTEDLSYLLLGYAYGIITCSIISIFLPAAGAFSYYALWVDEISGLPEGSGIFHLNSFKYFRDGLDLRAPIGKFTGIVTFPSFHLIMALIVSFAWRKYRIINIMIYIWSALVVFSTIPIGGHYAIDLFGGALVWVSVIASVTALAATSRSVGDFPGRWSATEI